MIKSMTGYGRCREVAGGKDIQVEVKSVNSRYIDATVKTGRLYIALEEKLKALASEYLSRGKVDSFLTVDSVNGDKIDLSVNREYLDSYVRLLRELKEEYDLAGEVGVSTVASRPEVFTSVRPDEDMEEVWAAVEPIARKAFDVFVDMRAREGKKLAEDLLGHLSVLESIRNRIAEKVPEAVAECNRKMRERICELLGNTPVDESRLLTECAIFADKADISEELARLDSHCAQFRHMLEEPVPVGRKLDFLVQEMNREVNTVGSKSSDTGFASLVIEAKSVIEKIREQIQNVE